MELAQLLTAWRGGLIVSCQASADSPLAQPEIIAALALTAERSAAARRACASLANHICAR